MTTSGPLMQGGKGHAVRASACIMRRATHFSFGLALAIFLALAGAPSMGAIYGPLFAGQQMTVSNYFR